MTDHNYPPNYKKNDKLQTYTENIINCIADIVADAEKELDDKDFGYFKSELGDYFNEI